MTLTQHQHDIITTIMKQQGAIDQFPQVPYCVTYSDPATAPHIKNDFSGQRAGDPKSRAKSSEWDPGTPECRILVG